MIRSLSVATIDALRFENCFPLRSTLSTMSAVHLNHVNTFSVVLFPTDGYTNETILKSRVYEVGKIVYNLEYAV